MTDDGDRARFDDLSALVAPDGVLVEGYQLIPLHQHTSDCSQIGTRD